MRYFPFPLGTIGGGRGGFGVFVCFCVSVDRLGGPLKDLGYLSDGVLVFPVFPDQFLLFRGDLGGLR